MKHTKETKELMSFNRKGEKSHFFGKKGDMHHLFGRKHTEETKLKMSKTRKGVSKSELHKLKISISKKGKNLSKEHKLNKSKKYIVISSNNEIEIVICMSEYCINNGLNRVCMSNVANGKQKNHRGYICYHYSDEKYKELLELYPQQNKLAA